VEQTHDKQHKHIALQDHPCFNLQKSQKAQETGSLVLDDYLMWCDRAGARLQRNTTVVSHRCWIGGALLNKFGFFLDRPYIYIYIYMLDTCTDQNTLGLPKSGFEALAISISLTRALHAWLWTWSGNLLLKACIQSEASWTHCSSYKHLASLQYII
jgi:hypothetical protein